MDELFACDARAGEGEGYLAVSRAEKSAVFAVKAVHDGAEVRGLQGIDGAEHSPHNHSSGWILAEVSVS
jgi:hypothetical protein